MIFLGLGSPDGKGITLLHFRPMAMKILQLGMKARTWPFVYL